ncbi:MAG: peptidoglycan DD-metalloendopeptidase family protein [Bacteroidia bacterium]|nr:peptidoglycan DD-metalloendopeptidase family protein [Bacteroidia bacterium]
MKRCLFLFRKSTNAYNTDGTAIPMQGYLSNTGKHIEKRLHLLVALLLLLPSLLFGQKNRKELEQRKKKLQQEMASLNNMLNEANSNKEITLTQLLTLNRKISIRQEIISTISAEVDVLQTQINAGNDTINGMQIKLSDLKKEYARMIFDEYANESAYSKLMFIFASKDFEQAMMRLKYLQIYEEYRHRQAILIDSAKTDLTLKVEQLKKKKEEKKALLGSQEDEKTKLANEKQEQQKIFTQLQGKEKKLRAQIAEKQRAERKLNDEIHKLIEEEIKKSNVNAGSKTGKKFEMMLTPEAKALSKTFESNKGKLPWPVVEGVIYKQFGEYSPMPGITENNLGIDIATTKGAVARAVFNGTVTHVVEVPSLGKVVMIRHGEFLTVYANLNQVFVKVGDKVDIKQNIGTILFDSDEGKADLQFQIWKGQDKLNPEEWLYSNN